MAPRSVEPSGLGPLALGSARLRAVVAGAAQAAEVQRCLEGAPGYFVLTEGAPPGRDAGARLVEDAEADPGRQVYLLLPRAAGPAAGVLDLHLDYPEPGTAQIGLLLLREACQGQGLGREAVEAVEVALAAAGYGTVRAAVLDENADARGFWEHLGYAPIGALEGGVTVLEKVI